MPPNTAPKPGFATSEFWLHVLVVIAGSTGFWEMIQHYLPIAQSMLSGNAAAAALLGVAGAFVAFMLTVVGAAKKYTDSREAVKVAHIEAQTDSPAKNADILGGAGKALALVLVFGLALMPAIARAQAADSPLDHAPVKSCVVDPDGSPVGHGVWLRDDQAKREATELLTLRTDNASLQASQKPALWTAIVVGVVLLGAGFGAGWYFHK